MGGAARAFAVALCLSCLMALKITAVAGDFIYEFNDAYSGAIPASPLRPWVEAMFQTVTPGTVRLTITNLHLTGSENVDQLYFNLNPADQPSKLSFKLVAESGAFNTPKISTGVNRFKAGSDGNYDVLFQFSTGGTGNNRFTENESVTYYITGISNLTASDFSYLSFPGGSGPFYAAAHVQRIGASATQSGWLLSSTENPLLVPEPSITGFCLLAFAAWFVFHIKGRCSSVKDEMRLARIPVRPASPRRQQRIRK